jgi:hypothetical protein
VPNTQVYVVIVKFTIVKSFSEISLWLIDFFFLF